MIQFSNSTSSKSYDYSDRYEQTLIYLCETIKDRINAKKRLSIDEFLAYCCHFIAQEIRTKSPVESIEDYLKTTFIELTDIVPLHDVRTIQFDAMIDDMQKRCIIVKKPNSIEYA